MASSDALLKQAEEQAKQAAVHMEKMEQHILEMQRLTKEADKAKQEEAKKK